MSKAVLVGKTLRHFWSSAFCCVALIAGCGGGSGGGDSVAGGASGPPDMGGGAGASIDSNPGTLYTGGVSPTPAAQLPAPVVTGSYKASHDRSQILRPSSDVLPAGSSVATIPKLASLRVDDTVEFADRVLRIAAVRGPGVYQVEEATPFDVFTKMTVSSRKSASAQRAKAHRGDKASGLADAATLQRWLTFSTDAVAAARTVYAVTKEFLDCTTFAAVEVVARPALHASGAASFSGHEFAAKDCKVYADSTGAITVDQNLALGADGEVTIDPDALTIGFMTEGAYATRTKVTVTAASPDAKSTYRLVNLVPDFLNPDSTTDYPETVKTLRKMLSMSIYLDLVVLQDVRGAKASAEFSGAGDFAFGGTATYDKAAKRVLFTSTTLTNGKTVSTDPAKAGVRVGIDQFDGRLGGGLQLGFLINFAQTTEDATAAWLTNTAGETVSSAATSGISASVSFNARARVGLGVFVDLNVGREVPPSECRFHLKGSLGYESFYAFAYRAGAAEDHFQYKDGPLFLFGDNEGVFTIRDFVAAPTQLIDGAKYCGPDSVLQVATEGRPKLLMRNLATGQVHAVDSAGGIAQVARPIPIRDLRNFSFEVDSSAIARYRAAGGIAYAWSSSAPASIPVSFPTSAQAMLYPICNNTCPPSVVATARISYGSKVVDLPVHVPVDNYPTPRGRFAVSSAGAVLDASASGDPEGDILEYQWYSPAGLIERSAARRLNLGADSAFAQDLLTSDRSPTLAVIDNRGQRSFASAVHDPSLAPVATTPGIASADFVSASPARLEVTFSQPMNPTYFTTGAYVPSSSVWETPTKFVVTFGSYAPGGTITLKAPTASDPRGFRSAAGVALATDYVFQFPGTQPPVGGAPVVAAQTLSSYSGTTGWNDPKVLSTCGHAWGMSSKALLRVDAAAIPPSATAAFLNLYSEFGDDNYDASFEVYRITVPWDGGGLVWPGPTIELPAAGSFAMPARNYGRWVRVPITDLVKRWQQGEPNHGVLLDNRLNGGRSGCRAFSSPRAASNTPYVSWQ